MIDFILMFTNKKMFFHPHSLQEEFNLKKPIKVGFSHPTAGECSLVVYLLKINDGTNKINPERRVRPIKSSQFFPLLNSFNTPTSWIHCLA
jgi:hypothetical protein